ncbi:MAG: hypothetical protein JWR26_2879 [Pedosphaera sp.]|nr:hypothetical protein [Pedosphaera sp.]
MKTLDQVEARIPVQSLANSSSGLYVISQPGSYYLTGNINGVSGKNGIEVSASNVSIDLNGYSLLGGSSGQNAIIASGAVNGLTVRNGMISYWNGKGIGASGASFTQFRQLTVTSCAGGGIQGLGRCLLTDCIVDQCGSAVGGFGISVQNDARIENCVVSTTQNGNDGITVDYGSVISHTTSGENTGSGIVTLGGFVRVENCKAFGNQVDGVRVASSFAEIIDTDTCYNGNSSNLTTAAGIHITGSKARIDHCSASNNNARGIVVETSNGFTVVTRNSATGNSTNYVIAAGNRPATIITYTAANGYTSGDPLANTQ